MSNKFIAVGIVEKILPTEQGTSKASGKDWIKGGLVINTDDEYNPTICFEAFGQSNIDKAAEFAEGEEVEVSFNVSSKEFNGKYYHSLKLWRIDAVKKP